MGLRPAAEGLRRELKYDDGKANWTLSQTAGLALGRERVPELSYEGSGLIKGKTAFAFGSNLSIQAGNGFSCALARTLVPSGPSGDGCRILWPPGPMSNS
jgi:hypothetical protein